jgi:hypothetical protein
MRRRVRFRLAKMNRTLILSLALILLRAVMIPQNGSSPYSNAKLRLRYMPPTQMRDKTERFKLQVLAEEKARGAERIQSRFAEGMPVHTD